MTATLYEKNGKYHISFSWMKNGKRFRKSKATGLAVKGNKKKAKKLADEYLREMESKLTDNYEEILVSNYLKKWILTQERVLDESTFIEYKRQIENTISPWFERRKILLSELEAHHLEEFYEERMTVHHVTASTIHRYHANIRKAIRQAVRRKLLKSNPLDGIELPAVERYRAEVYHAEEITKLFAVAQGSRIEAPIYIASYLGVRLGEACGLRWKDIDFDKGIIHIRGSLKQRGGNNEIHYGKTKTETSYRSLGMPPPLANFLLKHKNHQLEQQLLCGSDYNHDWLAFICKDELGNIVAPKYVSKEFSYLLKRNNLRKIRFHDLRHSCATLLLSNGYSLKDVQEWLGHKSYKTTADTYAHVLIETKKDMANTMSDILPSPKQNTR